MISKKKRLVKNGKILLKIGETVIYRLAIIVLAVRLQRCVLICDNQKQYIS